MTDRSFLPPEDEPQVVSEMRNRGAYVQPAHSLLAKEDPKFLKAYAELAQQSFRHGEGSGDEGLTELHRELVVIGILAFRGGSEESLISHLERALSLGASRRDLIGVFEAAVVPGGAPAMLNGLRALMGLEDRQSDQGEEAV